MQAKSTGKQAKHNDGEVVTRRIKRSARLISDGNVSAQSADECQKKVCESVGGGGVTYQHTLSRFQMHEALAGSERYTTRVVQHMAPKTSATVYDIDIEVVKEFQKFGLGQLCTTLCYELGIKHYSDLQWVNKEMVQEYKMKPVDREKFKALLRSYNSCEESGMVVGARSSGCHEVANCQGVGSVDSILGVPKGGSAREVGGEGGLRGLGVPKEGSARGVGGEEGLRGLGVPNEGNARGVGGEAAFHAVEVGMQRDGAAGGSEIVAEMHCLESYKTCAACNTHGHSMRLADAAQFLQRKNGQCLRNFYQDYLASIAKSPLTTAQINNEPYQRIRNEVEKETAAFILELCKKDVIDLRGKGYDVSCLFECITCKQNGSPKYMCDRARKGKDGEHFSQRDNGFTKATNVRARFWRLLQRCCEKK